MKRQEFKLLLPNKNEPKGSFLHYCSESDSKKISQDCLNP